MLNMFPFLEAAGYQPVIVFQPDVGMEKPDVSGLAEKMAELGVEIAYFQKIHGRSVREEAEKLCGLGIRTVYGVCDLVNNDMAGAVDATIVVTDYLKCLYDQGLHEKIHVVHDGIEYPDRCRQHEVEARRRLKAVLVTSSELLEIPVVGSPPEFLEVTVVGRYPSSASRLRTAREAYWKIGSGDGLSGKLSIALKLLDRPFKAVNWNIDIAYRTMAEADIGIIPVDMRQDPLPGMDVSYWQVKSENRLTMKMAMGLPVIASPVPSYEDVIVQGVNGFLASSRNDWVKCLEALRDPELRREMGKAARDSVIRKYSMEEQARKLVCVLDMLSGNSEEKKGFSA